ncbi:MAG: hypothetical protein EXX96DRAFT_546286 [Benjaminiella poitrasii]|nr:MAG: hypothetical protein EXX96DRAFT_546286 [Benjaminiella poitrasii]
MRIKILDLSLIMLFITISLVQETKAEIFCDLFNICSSTTSSAPGASSIGSNPSSAVSPSQPPSSSLPSSVQSSAAPTSAVPTSAASSITNKVSVTSASRPSQTSTAASTTNSHLTTTATSSRSNTSSTASPTQSSSETDGDREGNNIGVIVGSVCGFVAVIGAGFAYAFFSKTRRNNRKKRLYSENGDYDEPDPFNSTRLSPMTATAGIEDVNQHNTNGWMDPTYTNTNNAIMSPPPMAAIPKQDMYYNTGYADPYYNGQQAAYYDMGYQPQFQQYDPYLAQQQQQQQQQQPLPPPPIVPMHSPVMPATTNSTVYSAPHTYDDEEKNRQRQ